MSSRKRSAAAGAPASAPPRVRASARKAAPVKKLIEQLDAAALDKAQEKADEAGTIASIRDLYNRYDTGLIEQWGRAFEGFIKQYGSRKKIERERLLDTLARLKVETPKNLAELKANYLERTDKQWKGSGLHVPLEPSDSDSDDDGGEEGDEEAESDEETTHAEKKQKKSNDTYSTGPAAYTQSSDDRIDCPHCPAKAQTKFCNGCSMRRDQPYDSIQNADLRAERKAASAPAAAAAAPTGQSVDDNRSGLSKRDRELDRIASAGNAFPRFAPDVKFTTAQALLLSANSFQGSTYSPSTEPILRLIRSGKLTDIGYATPITLANVSAGKIGGSMGTALETENDGKIRLADRGFIAPPLESMRQFQFTLISVILPALLELPAASADWLALSRTAMELEAKYSWQHAKSYIEQRLTHSVHTRESFGTLDPAMVTNIIHSSHLTNFNNQGRSQQSHTPNPSPQKNRTPRDRDRRPIPQRQPQADQSSASGEACRNYNNGICTYASCKFRHVCWNCKKVDHIFKDCAGPITNPMRPKAADYFIDKKGSLGGRAEGASEK